MPAYAGMTGKHIGSKPENEGHGIVSLYPWYFPGNMPRFYATLRLRLGGQTLSNVEPFLRDLEDLPFLVSLNQQATIKQLLQR